jgi:hypothetical protein
VNWVPRSDIILLSTSCSFTILSTYNCVLTVVNVHHNPSTKCIKMVTSRNLGVLTDNFHEFWWFHIFCRVIPEKRRRRIELHKKNETCPRQNIHHRTQEDTRRHQSEAELQKVLERADRPPPYADQPGTVGPHSLLLEASSIDLQDQSQPYVKSV